MTVAPMLFFLAALTTPQADLEYLDISLTIERNPLGFDAIPRHLEQDELGRQLLSEAAYIVAGMIYGFDFVYQPGESEREQPTGFELSLRAEIVPGDPRLKTREIETDASLIRGRFFYYLEDFQRQRLLAWQSNALPTPTAVGEADIWSGVENRIAAIEAGVRLAIRDYLRERIYARPREIRGTVVLAGPPRIRIVDGTYRAEVAVHLQIEEVEPYRVF
ncbi:MAG: hypothetical protein ACOCW6_00020 [Spirochaetota bacterium]